MDLAELLYNYNPHWQGEFITHTIPRQTYLDLMKKSLKDRRITLLIGMRRVGKTTLIKQFIGQLIEQGISPKHILYLSLDHPELQKAELGTVIREFRKINELTRSQKLFVFLDEILYGKDVLQWMKVINDNENVKMFATSSSSMLKDRKAFLTGRTNTIRVKPLSFSEYLLFRNKRREPHLLERYFEEYLRDGGMPEYVLSRDPSYLVNLAEDIILKDVYYRHRIANISKVKELFLLVLSRVGKPITYSKLARVLSIKQETVEDYLSYLAQCELVHIVYRYAPSYNEMIYAPKKLYLGDVGFRYAFTGRFSLGSNFENMVFLKLVEKQPKYILEKGVELDFVVGKQIFECKFKRELTQGQKELLEKFKAKGYKTTLVKDYSFFL